MDGPVKEIFSSKCETSCSERPDDQREWTMAINDSQSELPSGVWAVKALDAGFDNPGAGRTISLDRRTLIPKEILAVPVLVSL